VTGADRSRRVRRARVRRTTQRRRRRAAGAILLCAVGVAVALAVALGGGAHKDRAVGGLRARNASTAARSTGRRAQWGGPASSAAPGAHPGARQRAVDQRPTAPAPGALPQTNAFPSSSTPGFRAEMAALWQGIVTGSAAPAMPAFFPKAAYLQVKEIPDAAADWSNRLVHDYALDIAAAHALLEPHAASARLLAVNVPSSYGHWVPPGTCYNGVGYFEVPNSRVVYSEGRQVHSFGIASMISWRGVWYVVHLGAVLREGEGGVVDEPSAGAGTSAYSGTC
jgi:hypothetical protein